MTSAEIKAKRDELAVRRSKRQCSTGNDGFNIAQEFLLKVGFEDGFDACLEIVWPMLEDARQHELTAAVFAKDMELKAEAEKLAYILEAVRSQMCWEQDRDHLTMGFADLHKSVTEALSDYRKKFPKDIK